MKSAISPELFLDEELAELSLVARYVLVGLISHADGAGRIECRPKRLEAQILPYEGEDFESVLWELEEAGYIEHYVVDAVSVLQVRTFLPSRRRRSRKPASRLPAPPSQHGRSAR